MIMPPMTIFAATSTVGQVSPLNLIIAVLTFLGLCVGGFFTWRGARKTAEVTRSVARDANNLAADKQTVESLTNLVGTLREEVARVDKRAKEDREEHDRHRQECKQEIGELNQRFEAMSQLRDDDRLEYRAEKARLEAQVDGLIKWGRQVVPIMREQGIEFPPPPPGITHEEAVVRAKQEIRVQERHVERYPEEGGDFD